MVCTLRIFQFLVIHTVKGFGIVNKAEIDVFLKLSCFFHDPDNHDSVTTHLEPDILECDIKWAEEASLQTKLVEVMEFQWSYFKS